MMCWTNNNYITDLSKEEQDRVQIALKEYFDKKYSLSALDEADIDTFVEDAMCSTVGEVEALIGCDKMHEALRNHYLNLNRAV